MRRLYDCLTFDHSSPGAMRPLYADFLAEAAGVLDDDALRDAADRYGQAGEVWAGIADAAIDGPLAPYRGMVERRLELLLGGDPDGALGTVAREVEAFTSRLEVTEADRLAQLETLAGLASRAVLLEQQACAALAGPARG
jgi:hypothetical protein